MVLKSHGGHKRKGDGDRSPTEPTGQPMPGVCVYGDSGTQVLPILWLLHSLVPCNLFTQLGDGKRARKASLHLHLLSLEGTHVIGELVT